MPNHDTLEQNRRVTVYLAPDDKQRLEAAARAEGLAVSTLIRQLLHEAGIIENAMQSYGTPGQGRRGKD